MSTYTYGTTGSGKKMTTLSNTAQVLQTAAAYAKRVHISAHEANSDAVVIGSSSIVAGAAGDAAKARIGYVLQPGASLTLSDVFLENLYISSVVSGDGVTYTYEA